MNLVFFEIKPLQKNKKLVHLFIYKSIFHFDKNELAFGTRKELTKNGFLQLALYLNQKKIKLYKFRLKRNYAINYWGIYKKRNKLPVQFIVNKKTIKLKEKKNFLTTKVKNFRLSLAIKRTATKLQKV